jgi:hypothetical protein
MAHDTALEGSVSSSSWKAALIQVAFLKPAALRARLVEQALPDGDADIASTHSTASRYGRMTFWTRLIWANFVRAALFGFGVRSR